MISLIVFTDPYLRTRHDIYVTVRPIQIYVADSLYEIMANIFSIKLTVQHFVDISRGLKCWVTHALRPNR